MECEARANQSSVARFHPVLLAGVSVVAAAPRFVGINVNLTEGESLSAQPDSHRIKRVIDGSLVDKLHPRLSNFVLHFWIVFFGCAELATRLLAALRVDGATAIYVCIMRHRVPLFGAVAPNTETLHGAGKVTSRAQTWLSSKAEAVPANQHAGGTILHYEELADDRARVVEEIFGKLILDGPREGANFLMKSKKDARRLLLGVSQSAGSVIAVASRT